MREPTDGVTCRETIPPYVPTLPKKTGDESRELELAPKEEPKAIPA